MRHILVGLGHLGQGPTRHTCVELVGIAGKEFSRLLDAKVVITRILSTTTIATTDTSQPPATIAGMLCMGRICLRPTSVAVISPDYR